MADKKPVLTWQDVRSFMESNGIRCTMNSLTGALNVSVSPVELADGTEYTWNDDIMSETLVEQLPSLMLSDIRKDFSGCSLPVLESFINICAGQWGKRSMPPLKRIVSGKWDGVDRLQALYDLMGIDSEDILSQVLIHKWLLQGVVMLQNDINNPIQNEGVLVLQGQEHAGKSSLLRLLALSPEWYCEGKLKDTDKDHERRLTTTWIAELSEIEQNMTSRISAYLKEFTIRSKDVYRLPYAKKDTVRPRYCNLAATCNSTDFLVRAAGYRRWWTVKINRVMPYSELKSFDFLQLWRQMLKESEEKGQDCFRLTELEFELLKVRNERFSKRENGEEEISDIISDIIDEGFEKTSFTHIQQRFEQNYPNCRTPNYNQIRAVLDKMGYSVPRYIKSTRYKGQVARWFDLIKTM